MLLKLILQNEWREATRSSAWQRNLVINIFLGLFVLYFLAIFALLGFVMDKLLLNFYPDESPADAFNRWVLLYFGVDLLIRFVWAELPSLGIRPLLHLPVRKSWLVHYLLGKAGLSVFNLLSLLLLVPFGIKALPAVYGWGGALAWLASLIAGTLAVHYLAMYLKLLLQHNAKVLGAALALLAALGGLEYFGMLGLSEASKAVWGLPLQMPATALAFLALPVLCYALAYRVLRANAYLEAWQSGRSQEAGSSEGLNFLQRLGQLGALIKVELLLILRSKRPRTLLVMGGFFVFYGGIFFPNPHYADSWPMLAFASIFVTGGFAVNYAQFFFSWESAHFDGLLTQPMDWRKYIEAKLMFTGASVFVLYLLSLAYGFLDAKFILLNTVTALYNAGFAVFVMLWVSTWNQKRLEVNQKASFNFQGTGAVQFIGVLPILAVPTLVMGAAQWLGYPMVGLASLGLLGLLGLVFRTVWIDFIIRSLHARKYRMAAGFRKEE
jgi:hypothetical protein